jgi:PKD repeat protein
MYSIGMESIIRNPVLEKVANLEVERMIFQPEEDAIYYIVLEYPNNAGGINYALKVLANKVPIARIDGDTLVNVNETARFTGENSTDDDGDNLYYSWDFDKSDGIDEDASKRSPSHVYREPGTYVITLIVTDGKENDSVEWDIRVNACPSGNFVIEGVEELNETTRLNLEQEYTFKAQFTDPDGDTMTYSWNFGDNTTGTGKTVKHTFAHQGIFTMTVTLTVKDIRAQGKHSEELTFNQVPESVRFEEPPEKTRAGKKVSFEGYGRDVDGLIEEYRWDFDGDGKIDQTTEEPYTDHKYKVPGTYNVSFYVVDDNGGITSANTTLIVKKKAVEKEDNTGMIAAAVVGVVVLLLVIMFVFRKKIPFLAKKEEGPTVAETMAEGAQLVQPTPGAPGAEAYPGYGDQAQPGYGYDQQQQYEQPYGAEGYEGYGYGDQQQQQQYEQPTQEYQPSVEAQVQQYPPKPHPPKPTGPKLVGPPKPLQKGTPRLVPPPKPTQSAKGPALVPPPKPVKPPK